MRTGLPSSYLFAASLFCGCLAVSLCASGCGRTPPGSSSSETPPSGRVRDFPPILHGFQAEPSFARAGATVELTFWSSEALPPGQAPTRNPDAAFAGVPMACLARGLGHTCTVAVTEEMGAGPRTFVASAVDATGNSTGPVTPPVEVVLDFEPPVLSARAESERVARGEPVSFLVEASEPLGALPAVTAPFMVGELRCAGPVPGTRFACTAGAVPETAPLGSLSFVATGEDRAGNRGTSAPGTLSIGTRPVVSIAWLGPSFLGEGGELSVGVAADQPLTRCGATVAGVPAACSAPAGPSCTCTFVVDRRSFDGTAEVRVEGENEYGTGLAVATTMIDLVRPAIDGALVSIARNDFGTDDGVRSAPDGAIDGGASYPGQGVRTVRVWSSALGGTEVLRVTPRADGSFDELALPGSADSTPRQLWASAVDAAGNEGSRVELSGADVEAPTLDREGLTLRHRVGVDSVLGAPGAVRDGPAGRRPWLRFYERAAGGSALGAPFLGDAVGGFTEQELGVSGLRTVWVEATDKAGNVARAQVGRVRETQSLMTWASAEPPPGTAVLVPFVSDDPRAVTPALGANGLGEAGAADTAAASTLDSIRAVLSASAVRDPGAGWSFESSAPAPRLQHAMAYDSARGVVVMFGGSSGVGLPADTWEFDGTDWSRRFPRVSPPARSRSAMNYDPARRRVVLFGGLDSYDPAGPVTLGDTWEYDGVDWTEVTPAVSPGPRSGHSMAYDAGRGRLVLFGGQLPNGGLDAGTWEYEGGSWVRATPLASPEGRSGHATAFDDARGRLVLFGGRGTSTDTWEYDGVTWTLVPTQAAPVGRSGHAMAYDPIRGTVVLTGGWGARGQGRFELPETWEFDGGTWTESLAPGPALPHGSALVWDSGRGTLVLHGGHANGGAESAETWERGPGDWRLAVPAPPVPLTGEAIVYDETQQTVLFFNGFREAQTWTYDPGTWVRAAPAASPPGLQAAAMAYDPIRGRTVLFGGRVATGDTDETWEYDGSSWTEQVTGIAPSVRSEHVMAYDAGRARIVLFGGRTINGVLPRDTWEYDGAGWTVARTATSPPGRQSASLAYDSVRQRLVLFGGAGSSGELADTWEYDGTDWRLIRTATGPSARESAGMSFDAVHSRIVLVGGHAGDLAVLDDTWEYDGADWVQMDAPVSLTGPRPMMTYDPVRGRSVLLGGPPIWPGAEIWEYVSLASTPRTPGHAALFPVDRGLPLVAFDATYVGSGRGNLRRTATPGVELLAWDAVQTRWISLGTHTATDGDPPLAQTIAASLPGRAGDYLAAEGVWLLAVPIHASSEYAGQTPSELATDLVELEVTYRIP